MFEQEQQFLVWLAVDLGLLTFAVLGLTVWAGLWRNWANTDKSLLQGIAGAPWLALTAIMVRVGYYAIERPLYVDLPTEAWHVLIVVCFTIGIIAPYWHMPKWALPPWYREHLKALQAEKRGGDGITR